MSAHGAAARGRPLAMLAVVGFGWVTMRAFFWEAPFAMEASRLLPATSERGKGNEPSKLSDNASVQPGKVLDKLSDTSPQRPSYVIRVALHAKPAQAMPAAVARHSRVETGERRPSAAHIKPSVGLASSKQQVVTGTGPNAPAPPEKPDKQRRWSVDAWVLWRQGSGIAQGRRPSYGASQAGAVLNYRLRRSSGHDPRIFVRGYRALIDNPETEVSLGLSARPVPDIPLRLHGEIRATERFNETEYRPSGFVTTEIAPQQLPFGTEAELYGQAGYVGGDFPTHFADGQLHVMRELKDFDVAKVSVGMAAWGGIQKGTGRADIGPSVRVDLDIGSVPARIAVDYRHQIAGDAEPGSGVAVTVSTRL